MHANTKQMLLRKVKFNCFCYSVKITFERMGFKNYFK